MVWERSLKDRTFEFAVAILKLYTRLAAPNRAYAHMALQLFRSASSIGAQLQEGDVANSPRDMGSKHAIALREAKESRYWIRLFLAVGAFVPELRPLEMEAGEFVAMLTTSVKKLRRKDSEEQKRVIPVSAFLFLTFALCLSILH
jgi:four helix bundle protein